MFKPFGIIPPVVTPFTSDGKVDEKAYRKMISHLIEDGVHGIFPLGTTGEFYAFDKAEVKNILEIAKDEVHGRVPIYAGASHITTRGTIELAHIAEEVGYDAVSVLTPMFVSQTQDELYEFYKTVAANTGLPLIMYNNKPKTNVTIAPDTVARLAQIKNIIGVKDSTGDFTNSAEYLRLTKDIEDFSVLIGRDTLIFAGLCQGAVGSIASCANVAPRLVADIYDKFTAGDLEGAKAAQFKLNPLRIACNMGTFPEVIKEALELEGYPVGKCLSPIGPLTSEQRDKLSKILKDMNLIK
ncbi:MAG: 4-hydroxy-tetrahydrodipicolinate synthase [Treponema sp.]|nr:4-hydroxy-tetrahydrodipicolinate synthase [Treponema sp.]